MASARKSVLLAGIKGLPEDRTLTAEQQEARRAQAESFREAAQRDMARVGEMGFDYQPYFIDVDDANALEDFKKTIASRQWHGVSLGFGIRGTPELTPLFEKLMNAAIEFAQPAPRFMFPLKPDKIAEAVQRVFPEGA